MRRVRCRFDKAALCNRLKEDWITEGRRELPATIMRRGRCDAFW